MSVSHSPTVADVIAATIGYDPPRDGLLGSGVSKMLAYQSAGAICGALGLPPDLDASTLKRWAAGEVIHLGPTIAGSRCSDLTPGEAA